jgi:tetratricopeptide (TPR) repeat protein
MPLIRAIILIYITLAAGLSLPAADDALFQRAVSLVKASRPSEAEALLRSVVEKDPAHTEARVLLGFLYLGRSAVSEAEDAFTTALNLRSEHAAARLGLGITWVQKGMARQAAQEFEKILGDRSLGDRARIHWIRSLFLQGRDQEALREARELAQRNPLIAEHRRTLAFLYQALGKNGQAFQEYKKAVELEPGNLASYLSLIGLSKTGQDWNGVLFWSERALDLDNNHPLLYQELELAYRRLGQQQEAEAARIESQRTYDAEMLFLQAARAKARGNMGEAEATLRRCLDSNPRLSKAWAGLGEILREKHQIDDARQAFLMALETDPENPLAHLGLAAILQLQGRDAEAASAYRRALSRGLTVPDLYAGLAAANLDQGKAQEAAARMLDAIRSLPDDPDLLSYMGYVQALRGETGAALEYYSQALRINSKHEVALLGEAQSAATRGDFTRAIRSFTRAVELNPDGAEGWQGLIHAYRKSGNPDRAELACRDCLVRNPGNRECREQLASLRMDASDYQESAREFQTLLRNGTATKTVLDGLGFSLLRNGEHLQSIELFKRSLARYGTDAWIHSNLGYLYRIRGQLEAAVLHYRRACEIAPGDAEKNHDLGFALYLARDYTSALQPLQTAVRLKPDWGQAHHNLAMTLWNLRQYGPALTHARSAELLGVAGAGAIVRALSANLSVTARTQRR